MKKGKKILSLLRDELLYTNSQIESRAKNREKLILEAGILNALLKDNIWRTFSDGGELQWIKNPEVLSSLSEAYYFVGAIKYLSDKYYDSVQFATEQSSSLRVNEILSTLEEAIMFSGDHIGEALQAIDKEIGVYKRKD
jgi:hypothetical protein